MKHKLYKTHTNIKMIDMLYNYTEYLHI